MSLPVIRSLIVILVPSVSIVGSVSWAFDNVYRPVAKAVKQLAVRHAFIEQFERKHPDNGADNTATALYFRP